MRNNSTGWTKRPNQVGILLDRCVDDRLARVLVAIPRVKAMTLSDAYGLAAAFTVADEVFLADAGRQGWIVLTQNFRMWHVPVERQAIIDNGTKVFSLANAQHTSIGKGLIFGRHLLTIIRRAKRPDACFWRLYADKTRKDLR